MSVTSGNKEKGNKTVKSSNGSSNGDYTAEDLQQAIDELDAKFSTLISFSRSSAKQRVASLTDDPGDEYLMNHKRRGKCIIFNHKVFEEKTLNERKGTQLDAYSLQRCFSELGFQVKTYDDLTVAEVLAMLRALAKEDHSDADCFVCCVMTHGDQANLWARNEKYPIDLLFNPFTADNCTTLTGKPKLFFIQACRGDKLDPGVVLKIGTDETDAAKYYTIPTWADFLISYSTVPGYYSWRNTRDGSWFMQSLVEVILRDAASMSFLDVITKVNKKVAYDYVSSVPTDKEYDKQKQVPSTIHMLTRRLVFRPKESAKKTISAAEYVAGTVKPSTANKTTIIETSIEQEEVIMSIKVEQQTKPQPQLAPQPQPQPVAVQVTDDIKI